MHFLKKISFLIPVLLLLIFGGWGGTGHRIINLNCFLFFPPQMNEFMSWADGLVQHASDADYRKGGDPTESPKHYIDIDSYPEFVANHKISQSYDSVVALHGLYFVTSNGTLPWAIITTYDTLKNCFARRDWHKAMLTAADLGHYVGDSHQPLHLTENYNPGGLHARYESDMLSTFQDQIKCGSGNVQYISNVSSFVFNYIYNNYNYVDSLIKADAAAKAVNSDTRSTVYQQKLWELTGNFTIALLDSASSRLASLIYTAWTNAGSPLPSGGFLPVELTSFNVNVVGNSVVLKWTTATEQNNLGFDIERSLTSTPSQGEGAAGKWVAWEKVAFVNGGGNSTESQRYSFIDKNLSPGNYSYRLKQIDFSGSYMYSMAVRADVALSPGEFNLYQNYPNPFNPETIIKYNLIKQDKVVLKLYDITGKEIMIMVNKEQKAGEHSVLLNASALASGIYFYSIKAGAYSAQKKMIVLK